MLNMAEIAADAGQLDPHVSVKSQDTILFGQMFNGLVRFRPGSMDPASIEPDLAERWESSSDGLTWTFYLRKGAKFHSGKEVTANDFKYWELMRRSSERGLKVFDYGRSKIGSGSYSFKKNWGFVPHPLNYEYRLYKRDAIPQNNPNNPKYQLMIAAWRRLPLWVANRLGPLIVRNLG